MLAAAAFLAWGGWVSLLAIDNSMSTHRAEATQAIQYQQLRADIAELKELMK